MPEVKILTEEYKEAFDAAVGHPIQSWAWGEFKRAFGSRPERVGFFENGKLVKGLQVIFSPLPKTPYTAGYCAKGFLPDDSQIEILKTLAKKHRAVFIKLEPDFCLPVPKETDGSDCAEKTKQKLHTALFLKEDAYLISKKAVHASPIFKEYNFLLTIDKTEEELLAGFNSKTRYNIRLAEKKGVTVQDNSTEQGIENYIRLMEETTKRQGFLNHNGTYFKKLFETFPKDRIRIFEAVYKDEVLTAWILFNFNGRLYYPYGASSNLHREVMPNNLIMWEAIKFGKTQGCTVFDLWGCLGPSPDTKDAWYGFHKFKAGYNPHLMQYIGTYDFVYKPLLYKLFTAADRVRRRLLQRKKEKIKAAH